MAALLLCAASPPAPAGPAFSYEPAANCPIYAAALHDPLFTRSPLSLRVINHASRRPAFSAPDTPLPTKAMAALGEPPWNEPAGTYQLLLTGPAKSGFLSVSCPWRRLGLNLIGASRDEGRRLTLSLPVLTADRTHALVYVQVQTSAGADGGSLWSWNGYVCAAAREAGAWRGRGCLHHQDAIYF